jgi:hypothetical protein
MRVEHTPFRIQPALPVQAYKTYQVLSPPYPVSCAQAACEAYLHGWRTVVDERTDLGQAQAHYIRTGAGRGFTEARNEAGLTEFTFAAGQRCFGQHRMPQEGAERFLVRPGDWRGITGPVREHTRAQFWVEDFAEHLDRLNTAIERG